MILGVFFVFAAVQAAPMQMQSLTGVRDSYPRLSPDGSKLIFHSNRNGRQAIWIANGDGSEPRLLFDDPAIGTNPTAPDWSPDGSTLAFAMRPVGAGNRESEVYLIGADGNGLRRITRSPGFDSNPHWSRSGRIYFNSSRATPDPAAPMSQLFVDIYSMRNDGSDIRRHTDCRASCTFPMPSPDERHVVHRQATDDMGVEWDGTPAKNSEIFVTALDGSGSVNVSKHPAYDGWPTWSPDGRWVAFASTRDGGAHHAQIFVVRPEGRDLRQATRGTWSRIQPSFSPDGKRILVNEHHESPEFEVSHLTQFEAALPQ